MAEAPEARGVGFMLRVVKSSWGVEVGGTVMVVGCLR